MVSLLASPAVIWAKNTSIFTRTPEVKAVSNSQVMPILVAYHNPSQVYLASGLSAIIDQTTLAPNTEDGSAFVESGTSGNGQISTYVVRSGDSIGSIATMFGVSANTIRWANNLSNNTLKVGQELVILPVSGVRHTVKSGDTIASIAKKYKAEAQDIIAYNGLEEQKLAIGMEVIIPDGEMTGTTKSSTQIVSGLKEIVGYYLRPIVGGRKSQNIHGHNAVDLAAPVGTPILASADGWVGEGRISPTEASLQGAAVGFYVTCLASSAALSAIASRIVARLPT